MNLINRFIKKIRRNEHGSILVEIALSIPVYIGLLTGTVEMGNYLLLHMKLQHTVVSIADLVTRDETINEAVMTDIFLAVPQIMAPYDSDDNALMYVSSISQTEDTPATIFWQRSGGGTFSATSQFGEEGDLAVLPDTLTMRDNETILVTEIFFQYEPLVFEFLPEATLSRTSYFRPRIGTLQGIEDPDEEL